MVSDVPSEMQELIELYATEIIGMVRKKGLLTEKNETKLIDGLAAAIASEYTARIARNSRQFQYTAPALSPPTRSFLSEQGVSNTVLDSLQGDIGDIATRYIDDKMLPAAREMKEKGEARSKAKPLYDYANKVCDEFKEAMADEDFSASDAQYAALAERIVAICREAEMLDEASLLSDIAYKTNDCLADFLIENGFQGEDGIDALGFVMSLPFNSYEQNDEQLKAAGDFLRDGPAQAVEPLDRYGDDLAAALKKKLWPMMGGISADDMEHISRLLAEGLPRYNNIRAFRTQTGYPVARPGAIADYKNIVSDVMDRAPSWRDDCSEGVPMEKYKEKLVSQGLILAMMHAISNIYEELNKQSKPGREDYGTSPS